MRPNAGQGTKRQLLTRVLELKRRVGEKRGLSMREMEETGGENGVKWRVFGDVSREKRG